MFSNELLLKDMMFVNVFNSPSTCFLRRSDWQEERICLLSSLWGWIIHSYELWSLLSRFVHKEHIWIDISPKICLAQIDLLKGRETFITRCSRAQTSGHLIYTLSVSSVYARLLDIIWSEQMIFRLVNENKSDFIRFVTSPGGLMI